jgi:hypothetical protein
MFLLMGEEHIGWVMLGRCIVERRGVIVGLPVLAVRMYL